MQEALEEFVVVSRGAEDPAGDARCNDIHTLGRGGRRRAMLLPAALLGHYVQHGLFEGTLIDFCREQLCSPERVLLDVGAHTGTYALCLADRCRRVYAFEPQRATFYALCGGVALSRLSNVVCLNYALGSAEQAGTRRLHVRSPDGGGSSLHAPPPAELLDAQDVEVRTLDEVAASLQLEPLGLVKLDVEGNELQALRGARETLRRHRPKILFEANSKEHLRHVAELLQEQHGYRITKISSYDNMYLADH